MSPTMHKYLIHGPEIISSALLPIGQLREEAQEAGNKNFKRYREHNSRKCGRLQTNEDTLHSLLINSDPLITQNRNIKRKKIEYLPKEVIAMLKPPDVEVTGDDEDSLHDDSDDSDLL